MNISRIARRTTITLGLAAAAFGLSVGSASATGDTNGDAQVTVADFGLLSATAATGDATRNVTGNNTFTGTVLLATGTDTTSGALTNLSGDNTWAGTTAAEVEQLNIALDPDDSGARAVGFDSTMTVESFSWGDGGGGGGGGGDEPTCWDWTDAETGKSMTECN